MGDTRVKSGLGKSEGGERGREGGRPARSRRHDTSLDAGVYLDLAGPVTVIFSPFELPPSPVPAKQ